MILSFPLARTLLNDYNPKVMKEKTPSKKMKKSPNKGDTGTVSPEAAATSAVDSVVSPNLTTPPVIGGAKTMADLLARQKNKIRTFTYGDIIEGTIVSLTSKEILIDLGAKSEGIITGRELGIERAPARRFKNKFAGRNSRPYTDAARQSQIARLIKNLKVGDKIAAFVLQAENDQGYIVLSLRRAAPEQRWHELETIYEKDEPLTVTISEYNRGGFLVDAAGVTGFVPMSHLSREHLASLDANIPAVTGGGMIESANETEEEEIEGELLVEVPAEGLPELPEEALKAVKEEKRKLSEKKAVTNPDLVWQSDESRDKKANPLIGEKLTVKIIEMDRAKNRLVLSEKEALTKEDREKIETVLKTLTVGEVLDGTVTGVMPFGLFVELMALPGPKGKKLPLNGVEGLVHVSELAWEKVAQPRDLYRVGDKVKVKVLEVDPDLFRIALSIKQTETNPWDGAEERYTAGSIVEGEVIKIVPFGAFVRLEKGLDGLIHVTETTGPLKVGERIKAFVIEVNPTEQRLALSIKKLSPPPPVPSEPPAPVVPAPAPIAVS